MSGAHRRPRRRTGTGVALAVIVLAVPLALGVVLGPLGSEDEPRARKTPASTSAEPSPSRSSEAPSQEPASARAGLDVQGIGLLRDGEPFVPRGFTMIGLLTPEWCHRIAGIEARAHFGQAELDAARSWGADTLRFQVSQRGLADPTLPQADRDAYLAHVVAGVQLARSNGYAVIVSMQDQRYGCGETHPLPSRETVDAWSAVAPPLMGDPHVAFELFNEPRNTNDAPAWAQWRNGGSAPDPNLGDPAVGHQALIDHLRGLGSENLLIVDTARMARLTTGMPQLSDPLGRLAYGIHPYTFESELISWNRHYTALAARAPVIATEWNYVGRDCGTAKELRAPDFLEYLREHSIGLLGHAFDEPGTLVADWSWTPTACGSAVGGSGELLRRFFAGD